MGKVTAYVSIIQKIITVDLEYCGIGKVSLVRTILQGLRGRFSFKHRHGFLGNTQARGSTGSVVIGIFATVVVVVLILMAGFIGIFPGFKFNFTGAGSVTTATQVVGGANCSGALAWQSIPSAYNGATLTSGAVNSYKMSGGSYTVTGETTSLTSGKWGPTASSYAPGSILLEGTATSAYPQWILDNSPGCVQSQSVAGLYYYNEPITLYNAPASGTSATTNVEAVFTYPSGSAPTLGTTATTVTVNLEDFSANTAAGIPVTMYGTSANPVTIFAPNGQSSQSTSGTVPLEMALLIAVNSTSANIVGISGQPQPIPLSGGGINTAVLAYLVPLSSGVIASGTTSASNPAILSVGISVSTTATTGHTEIVAQLVDLQQPNYLQYHSTVTTTFPAAGSAAGLVSGWSFSTPTTYNGGLSPLCEQNVAAVYAN